MPHLKPVGHQSWKGPHGVVLSSNHDYGNTQHNGRTEISQKGARKTLALGCSWNVLGLGAWEVGGHTEATRLTCDARLARHGSKSKHPVCLCGPTSALGFSDILKCNPESTNWMVRLVLIVATAAFTSFGTTSPPGQINVKPDSRLLRLQLSGHPGGTSCSRPCTCRAEDRTCYYLVVAATTYLSPKRGLEATYQAQKGALSRVLHGSELHHRAERAKK